MIFAYLTDIISITNLAISSRKLRDLDISQICGLFVFAKWVRCINNNFYIYYKDINLLYK